MVFAIFIWFMIPLEAFCQIKHFNTESEYWFDGVLYLKDGRSFNGDINYIFVNDLVRIRNSRGQIKTLVASNVSEFVLFDSLEDRRFYALPYDVASNGIKVPLFFEALYSNESYSVLSRHVVKHKIVDNRTSGQDFSGMGAVPVEKVYQVIYLADTQGKIMALLERRKSLRFIHQSDYIPNKVFSNYENAKFKKSATQKEVKKYCRAKDEKSTYENSFLDLDLIDITDQANFKDFFGKDYRRFKAYVESKKLNPKKLEDLVPALDFKS